MHIVNWCKIRIISSALLILMSLTLSSVPSKVITASINIPQQSSIIDGQANPFSEEDQSIIEEQSKGIEAFELFMKDIPKDTNGDPIYPDNLGGLYLDDGFLVIAYVGSNYESFKKSELDDYRQCQ